MATASDCSELCPCCARALMEGGFSYPERRRARPCGWCGKPCRSLGCAGRANGTRKRVAATAPLVACTDADLRGGPTAGEPCPACHHPKRVHDFDPVGCEHAWYDAHGARRTCGCREWDPLCTAVETGDALDACVDANANVVVLRPHEPGA